MMCLSVRARTVSQAFVKILAFLISISCYFGSVAWADSESLVDVYVFPGVGIRALHTELPLGVQVNLTNPETGRRIAARVVGRPSYGDDPKSLFITEEAARVIGFHDLRFRQMVMSVNYGRNSDRRADYGRGNQYDGPGRSGTAAWDYGIAAFPEEAPMERMEPMEGVSNRDQGGVRDTFFGKASYYAGKYHGRTTANGEMYDMHAMTCAHPKLPFGTKVRITNQETGAYVILRVNDRGPFKGGRIVDVSYAAAERLGMVKAGIIEVRLDVLGN